jgi:hypothetical protein
LLFLLLFCLLARTSPLGFGFRRHSAQQLLLPCTVIWSRQFGCSLIRSTLHKYRGVANYVESNEYCKSLMGFLGDEPMVSWVQRKSRNTMFDVEFGWNVWPSVLLSLLLFGRKWSWENDVQYPW